MNLHEVFIYIHQGCFAGTGAIVRLPQCQWSKPDGYGKISQCITTTKHSKAKTVCIFLGVYCNNRQHASPRHEVATDVKQMPIRPIIIIIIIINPMLGQLISSHNTPVAYFIKEVSPSLDKRPLKFIGGLLNFLSKMDHWRIFSSFTFSSLWTSGTILYHGRQSALVQVMACYLTAPCHHLNRCWLIISSILCHSH